VFAVSGLAASSAGAAVPVTKSYLALGDSLAFGYSQELFNQNVPFEPPTAFEHGYVNQYFNHLKPKTEGVQLQNNGCPGETTDSMLGNGPLQAALSGPPFEATGESPCAYHKAGLPLHHEYGGVSQVESALATIAIDAGMGKPVEHITLNIGANDELHAIKLCEEKAAAEVKVKIEKGELAFEEPLDKETGEKLAKECIVGSAPALFAHIIKNAEAAIFAIREGQLFGGVKYTGPINFMLSYDPYGAVFVIHQELLPLSNVLTNQLNDAEAKNLPALGVCTANPHPYFNPENKLEPERLQKLTNMANFTESNSKKNGPDIHPTKEGYVRMSLILVKACG
jgi:lysophospholipase L1-like esterase